MTPSFNRLERLKRLLSDLRRQTSQPDAIVVVDDASPDAEGYARVVGDHASGLPIRHFRLDERSGACVARNTGARMLDTDILLFVDDDERLDPGHIEELREMAGRASREVGLIHTCADSVTDSGDVLFGFRNVEPADYLKCILRENVLACVATAVTREAFETAGGFDPSFPSCQDWDLWVRIAEGGFRRLGSRAVTARHVIHGEPSIRLSSASIDGYVLFYAKHERLFISQGLRNHLAGRLAWLSGAIREGRGSAEGRRLARHAIAVAPWNPRALIACCRGARLPRGDR